MKTSIKIFTSILLIAVLSMALFVSASATPYAEPAYNAAVTVNPEWKIYSLYGRVYDIYAGTVIGPGSTDSQYTSKTPASSPVSAAQDGLNSARFYLDLSFAPLSTDGVFGGATTTAVKDFQYYVHYNVDSAVYDDGWIGSLTWPYLAYYSKQGYLWNR